MKTQKCKICDGEGSVIKQDQSAPFFLSIAKVKKCKSCKGTGKTESNTQSK